MQVIGEGVAKGAFTDGVELKLEPVELVNLLFTLYERYPQSPEESRRNIHRGDW